MSKDQARKNCQHCGHPVLQPSLSDYCTNCGKLTGIPKIDTYDPSYIPTPDEILFEIPALIGRSYEFLPDKFLILKGSKQLEEIPYSKMQDCEVRFVSHGAANVSGYGIPSGPSYSMRITITLKENPPRYIELETNPTNGKLESNSQLG